MKLIAILMYINAGFALVYALVKLVVGQGAEYRIPTIFGLFGTSPSWSILVLFHFAVMVLFCILGWGLWKGINIIRITVILLGIVSIIGTVTEVLMHLADTSTLSTFRLIVGVIIRFAVIYYLTGNKASKYFGKVDSDSLT